MTHAVDYMNGTLMVDEFVTHHQTLSGINAGFDDMHVRRDPRLFVYTSAALLNCLAFFRAVLAFDVSLTCRSFKRAEDNRCINLNDSRGAYTIMLTMQVMNLKAG